MIKKNILTDLATYSKMTNKHVDYLTSLIEKFICNAVLEAKLKEEDKLVVNLGISNITINLSTGEWTSIPSDSMRESFAKSANGDFDPFEEELTAIISKKLLNIIDNEVR